MVPTTTTTALIAAATLLQAAYAQDVFDTFTVNCQPLTVQRRDPLVQPGADLSDHVHSVIGGTAFSASLDPTKALASGATTCDKELDHSVYWTPQLYHITADGKYEIVKFTGSVSCDLTRPPTYILPTYHEWGKINNNGSRWAESIIHPSTVVNMM